MRLTILVAGAYGLLIVLQGLQAAYHAIFASGKRCQPGQARKLIITKTCNVGPSWTTKQILTRNKLAIQRADLILNNQWCFRCQGQCRCGMWSKIFVAQR